MSSGTSTTGDPTTGDPTTSSSPTTTGATTGDPLCEEPDAEPLPASWSLGFEIDPQGDLLLTCTVSAVLYEEPKATVDLDCVGDGGAQLAQLVFSRTPYPSQVFWVGQQIELDYRVEWPFWTNQWFAIRDDATPPRMILAGVSADRLAPPGATAEAFYDTPLEVVHDLCAAERYACGTRERLALDITWLGITVRVFDGQFGANSNLPGTYSLWLKQAVRMNGDACDDTRPEWYEALMQLSIGP